MQIHRHVVLVASVFTNYKLSVNELIFKSQVVSSEYCCTFNLSSLYLILFCRDSLLLINLLIPSVTYFKDIFFK